MYEGDTAVSQYCEAHYGEPFFGVENFPVRCAQICLELMRNRTRKRALDIGCSIGRASFELAREFDFVSGLDFYARFIRIAHQMQERGVLRYELPVEGEIVSFHERKLQDIGLSDIAHKVEFFQADAQNLKPQFSNYDLVLAANLIDRLSRAIHFLTTIHERINREGLLVIASPYTWIEDFTKRENWVGGYRRDGEPHTTLDGLKELLSTHFTMVGPPREIEFVTRETSRKFQHSISQLTVWQKQ